MRIVIFYILLIFGLLLNSCDLSELLNKVEVSYDIEYLPHDESPAMITYMQADGKVAYDTIGPGSWTFNGIFSDGDQAGVWVETQATKGTVGVYLVAWYSELNDLEDYVDAWTWTLPIKGNVGLETVIDRTVCRQVSYTVTVEGTNGMPVEITYTEKDYESQSLTSEANLSDGIWRYSECFPVGSYASISLNSVAISGTATITLNIDYPDKTNVNEVLIIDFSTNTKTGALGFPVE